MTDVETATVQEEQEKTTKINKLVLDGFKSFGRRTELLFGDDFNVILGPNGSGKCVHGDTLVQLADGSQLPIRDLVEDRLKNQAIKAFDDGVMAVGDGTEILALNKKTLKAKPKPILSFVKRTSPEELVRIRTRSGREIVATAYHPLFVMRNNKIVSVKAEELRSGIKVAVPRELCISPQSKTFFDLLDLITVEDNLYVPFRKDLRRMVRNAKNAVWKRFAEQADIPYAILKGFLGGQSINFAYLVRLLRHIGLSDKEIISLIPQVKSFGKPHLTNIPWKNSPEFARVLGYLLAEGRMTDSNQLWFTNGTDELVQDYAFLVKKVFGSRTTINEYKANVWDVITYSHAAGVILKKFGMGSAGDKRIADMFLRCSGEEELHELLNGLYCGDGCISKNSIDLTTKSLNLAKGVETVLLRIGILCSVKDVIKVATNNDFSGKYKHIAIYGQQNFERFSRIKLTHPKKRQRILDALGKKYNSNLDVFEVNSLVKKVAKDLQINVKKIRKSHSVLDAYCYNQCLPTRMGVKKLIKEVFRPVSKGDETSLQVLQVLADSDIYWDEIIEIEHFPSQEEWVYDLCVAEDHNFIANNFFVHNSNVSDALCFVLGRSSSKSLRAEKSANLIYNGGKIKNPANSAEVSIFFDNASRLFPFEENEVKVTRIVRKDGASKYKINNKTRTRTEVLELLNQANIDSSGYNIVMQGDIVSLVEMSSIDRRGIIEDIAGIRVYEEKKERALKELSKVDEKLNECEIILKERASGLKDLKKDRDQALKYKELSDNIRKNKASFLKRKLDKKEDSQKQFQEKMDKQTERLNKFREGTARLRGDIQSRKEKIRELSQEIEEKGSAEIVELNKRIEEFRINLATQKTRVDQVRKEIHRIDQRKEQLSRNLADISDKGKSAEQERADVRAQLEDVDRQLNDVSARLDAFKKKQGLDKEGDLQKQIEELDHQSEDLQRELQVLTEQSQAALREKDKIEFQLQTIDHTIAKVKQLEKQHADEIVQLKKSKEDFKKSVLELNSLLNQDSKDAATIARLRVELQKRNEDLAKLNVKHAGYKEQLAGNIAVKKIIENKRKFGGVFDTVSDLGAVSEKYSLALEVAASQRINSVVVDDSQVAQKCISYLKSQRLGIATFLPLNNIKPVRITADMKKLAKDEDVVGFAIDLVDFDPQFKDVFSYVFGSTLVVKDLDAARRIGIGKIRMVTLDGDLCEFSGAMVGGYRHRRHGSFKEKELAVRLQAAEQDVTRMESELSELESRRSLSDSRIVSLREKKAELEGGIIRQEKALHLDTGDIEANRQYKQDLKKNLKEQDEIFSKMEERVAEQTTRLTEIKMQRQQVRQQFVQLRSPTVLAELNAFEQKRTDLIEQRARLQAEDKRLEMQVSELIGRDQENTEKVMKELDREKKEFRKEQKELENKILSDESELKDFEKQQQDFQSKHRELFQKRNKISDEITVIEGKLLKHEEEFRKEELSLNTLQLQGSQLRAEIATLKEEFAQYEGVEIYAEKSDEQLKKEISDFERMMSRIGAVNMRALDTYEAAEKAYNELTEKKGVLVQEKDSIVGLMEVIEKNKTELFMVSFDAVNAQFKKIFSELSTKGEASLELENPEVPFEAGMRIKVCLTGDKFLDIRSLSGGEKTMTALAFIFAIQEHEPANFYILDEVDAALDKSNSDKLAKLIRKYCSRAQYIVISHKDSLILEGDVLYGVSMNTRSGVSGVVSLKG